MLYDMDKVQIISVQIHKDREKNKSRIELTTLKYTAVKVPFKELYGIFDQITVNKLVVKKSTYPILEKIVFRSTTFSCTHCYQFGI